MFRNSGQCVKLSGSFEAPGTYLAINLQSVICCDTKSCDSISELRVVFLPDFNSMSSVAFGDKIINWNLSRKYSNN